GSPTPVSGRAAISNRSHHRRSARRHSDLCRACHYSRRDRRRWSGRIYLSRARHGKRPGNPGRRHPRRAPRARRGFRLRLVGEAVAAELIPLLICHPERSEGSMYFARTVRAIMRSPSATTTCLAALLVLPALLVGCGPSRENRIVIGSKNFTEQLILGELIAQQLESRTSLRVERRFYLAGTFICHQAILAGRVDIYPEYTGTALTAVLKEKAFGNPQAVYERVKAEYRKRFNLDLGAPFGFNDTFAIEIRGEDARHLHLKTISQAAAYTPQWRPGFGYEFMERPDGYKGLVAT